MKHLNNTFWMLLEHLVRAVSGVLVVIYIARYLGAEEFGQLSYAIAILGVFLAVSRLGMDAILVRELSVENKKSNYLLGTGFWMLLGAAVFSAVLMAILAFLADSPKVKLLILIVSSALFFQVFFVIDYFFQSQLKAIYSSAAKSAALLLGALLKICVVFFDLGLIPLAVAYAADYAFMALFLLVAYLLRGQRLFFYFCDRRLILPLAKDAWTLTLSALAVVLYMRIDQLMIRNMLGDYSLGIYSAAAKIYEGWIMIPYVVSVSLLPVIVRLRSRSVDEYEKKVSQLYFVLCWGSIAGAASLLFIGDWLVTLLYGEAFRASADVLIVLMWASVFASMGFVSARCLTVEGMQKKIFQRTFAALILNVILNALLIPDLGVNGAAISTLVALLFANYVMDYFDPDLRGQLKLKNKVIANPFTVFREK